MNSKSVIVCFGLFVLVGCAPKRINAVVDTLVIEDPAKFEKDKVHCSELALTYNLDDEKLANGALGGAIGGCTVAGAALAIGYGTINPVSIPFIAGATLLGGAVGAMSTEERVARENIMYQCLSKYGYTVYSPR